MRLLIAHKDYDDKVTRIIYNYLDRHNGWYCYAHNAAGDQIGDAVYQYHKADVLVAARQMADEYGVTNVNRL